MQIRVRRSGGFAGIEEERAVDTASARRRPRERLERLVQEAEVFALPATVEGEVGADQFRYEVEVDDAGRARTRSRSRATAGRASRRSTGLRKPVLAS